MDKNTILAMGAGEELDKLVATEVMEELMPQFTPQNALDLQLIGSPVKSPKGNWLCLCKYDEGDIPTWRPVPFSTDISATWHVVEKMKPDMVDLRVAPDITECIIWPDTPKGYVCITELARVRVRGIPNKAAPEAICKAALLTRLDEIKKLEKEESK